MFRIRLLLFALCSGALFQVGCSRPLSDGEAQPRVAVAVNEPLAAITSEVAGDGWDVVTLIPAGADPESFDPTVATLRKVEQADLMVAAGVSASERAVTDRLGTRGTTATVDLSRTLRLITDTHGSSAPDPHFWTSPVNVAEIAAAVAEGLAAVDSLNAADYRRRADSLANVAIALRDSIASHLASAAGPPRVFVTNHPSMSYFARDFGLRQIAVGEENKELSAKALAARIADIRREHPAIFFVESQADSARAATIASEAGLRVAVLPTNGSDPLATIAEAARLLGVLQ